MPDPDPVVSNVDDAVTSQIGRVVAFVVTPVLLPVLGALAVWLQDKVGINMDPAVLVGFVVSVVAGTAALAYKWLHNRGEYEKVVLELHKLYEAGAVLVDKNAAQALPSGAAGAGQDMPKKLS